MFLSMLSCCSGGDKLPIILYNFKSSWKYEIIQIYVLNYTVFHSGLLIKLFLFIIYQDGESGWSSLHRALHFGHLAVASILLQFGASITLEDSKYRTPVDLISGPVLQVLGSGWSSGIYHVLIWCLRFMCCFKMNILLGISWTIVVVFSNYRGF